ncbi:MAG: hypothetical protein FWD57_03370 [Polyangiaceae bacterium]|nr:hypothetical protein [Polyangiaceae bacterium]
MKNTENNEPSTADTHPRIVKGPPPDVAALIDERTNEDPDRHMIRYLLSFPPNQRTNFLRVPLPNGGSAL